MDGAKGVTRCGNVDGRDLGVAKCVVRAVEFDDEGVGVLVDFEQVKDPVGGGQQQAVAAGEDERSEDARDLGQVGHPHPVTMVVENVEGGGGGECVAKRVLLVKVRGAVFIADDDSPFIDDEGDFFGRVEAVHDGGVAVDDLVHAQGIFQGVEILIGCEVGRIDGFSSVGDCFTASVGSSASTCIAVHPYPLQPPVRNMAQHVFGPVVVIVLAA